MCIAFPGRVVSVGPTDAVVDIDGRRRHASMLLEPGIAVDDWVLVAAGTVLRRLEPDEAADLAETLSAAMTAGGSR
jgi:hydrogenase assembly chaperone HypC/HupF